VLSDRRQVRRLVSIGAIFPRDPPAAATPGVLITGCRFVGVSKK